jgi:hypothetical protein
MMTTNSTGYLALWGKLFLTFLPIALFGAEEQIGVRSSTAIA